VCCWDYRSFGIDGTKYQKLLKTDCFWLWLGLSVVFGYFWYLCWFWYLGLLKTAVDNSEADIGGTVLFFSLFKRFYIEQYCFLQVVKLFIVNC